LVKIYFEILFSKKKFRVPTIAGIIFRIIMDFPKSKKNKPTIEESIIPVFF
jgi:hypothetical protein